VPHLPHVQRVEGARDRLYFIRFLVCSSSSSMSGFSDCSQELVEAIIDLVEGSESIAQLSTVVAAFVALCQRRRFRSIVLTTHQEKVNPL